LIYFQNQLIGGPVTPDANGAFTTTFCLPQNPLPPGPYPVFFTNGRENFNPPFTITAGTPGNCQTTTTSVILERAVTYNGQGNFGEEQTIFTRGEVIRYAAIVNNLGSSAVTAKFELQVTGPRELFSWTGDLSVPPGLWRFHFHTSIPTDAPFGIYTHRVTMTYNGQTSTKDSLFTVPPAKYVALGDSYSSGEGAIDSLDRVVFIDGTDTADRPETPSINEENRCHRATDAYPELVKQYFDMSEGNFTFRACSGAMMADFYKEWGLGGQWNEPAQLKAIPSGASNDVELVTLSIGGNDFGFAQILDQCIDGFWHWKDEKSCLFFADIVAAFGKILLEQGGTIKVSPAKDFPGTVWSFCDPECVKNNPGNTITLPSLSDLYKEIHTRAPKAKIRVLLYPRLFSANIVDRCVVKSGIPEYSVKADIAKKLNDLADNLNGIIQGAIQKVKNEGSGIDIKEVNPNTEFNGHRLCDMQESWINGLILNGVQASEFSFHPNAEGQRRFEKVFESNF
jgi:hypothetical protein